MTKRGTTNKGRIRNGVCGSPNGLKDRTFRAIFEMPVTKYNHNLIKICKAATALGAGGCSTGNGLCGGLIGGIMVIGSKIGRERKDFKDLEGMWKTRDIASKLYDKFTKEYGSGNCRAIQTKLFGRSYNLLDPTDKEAFEKAGGHTDKCTSVVGNASKWTVEILLEQ